MLKIAASLIPTKALIVGGGIASINKRVIFPAAAQTATWLTTKTGLLTYDEAKEQEQTFNEILFPVNKIITDLENEVVSILSNSLGPMGEYVVDKLDSRIIRSGSDKPQNGEVGGKSIEQPDATRSSDQHEQISGVRGPHLTPKEEIKNDPVIKYI